VLSNSILVFCEGFFLLSVPTLHMDSLDFHRESLSSSFVPVTADHAFALVLPFLGAGDFLDGIELRTLLPGKPSGLISPRLQSHQRPHVRFASPFLPVYIQPVSFDIVIFDPSSFAGVRSNKRPIPR